MLIDVFCGHIKSALTEPYTEKAHEDISFPFVSSKVDDWLTAAQLAWSILEVLGPGIFSLKDRESVLSST